MPHGAQHVRGLAKKAKKQKAKTGAKAKKAARSEAAELEGGAGGAGTSGQDAAAATAAAAGDDDDDDDDVLDLKKTQAAMDRVVAYLTSELKSMRAGGADASMFDHVQVDLYGAPSPLAAVGQVKVSGPSEVAVSVFDPGAVEAVQVAIRDCGMGLNPQLDGNVVLVPIPRSTAESRQALAKAAAQAAESAKGASRGVRKKHMNKLKGDAVEGVSEDEVKRLQKEVQAIADGAVKKIDDVLKAKQDAILNF